jgi:hypothetical protein
VFYLGFDPPDEVELPYTVEVIIQPHDADGKPLDHFVRKITVEELSQCSIATGFDYWQWMYTQIYLYNDLFQVTAPFFSATFDSNAGGYYYGKCCIPREGLGIVEVYPGDSTEFGICGFGNPYYKRVLVTSPYSLRGNEQLYLFPHGEYRQYVTSLSMNFNPAKSNICALFAYYDNVLKSYEKIGTHNYSEGVSQLQLTTQSATPSNGPSPPFGNFINSCHVLIFTLNTEGSVKVIFQRQAGTGFEPESLLDVWFNN